MGYGWNYRREQVEGEAWQCKTCGLMVTYGHVCKVRETVKCPDCAAMLEKGQEGRHFKYCAPRLARVKAEKTQRAKERRLERKEKGLVSYVRKLPEKESMVFMEPMMNGDWDEVEVEKYPWKCKICGLVWQTREDAESCPYTRDNPFMHPKLPHSDTYTRLYGVRYVENGVPHGAYMHEITFKAMRKEEPEPLPEGKKWDLVAQEVEVSGHGAIRSALQKAKDAEFQALRDYANSLEAALGEDKQ